MKIHPTIRPLPYYTVSGSIEYALLAKELRFEFKPKVSRRLPTHHLCGFRHDTVVRFVSRYRKRFPYFLRTDIAKFYPSVRHQDLIVGMQIAYRDLLGLNYVPKEFKRKYVSAVSSWCKSLPLARGIPLGSPLSAILAPVMLLPVWLALKRRFSVPFLVYMDDVLILCEDEQQCGEIYAALDSALQCRYDLSLHIGKTSSGALSRQSVDFCGWHFSGGYASICESKAAAFRQGLSHEIASCRGIGATAFLKRINRRIDGFGNYYKHGDVSRQFGQLDKFIRKQVRGWYARHGIAIAHTNEGLFQTGLHSLVLCYEKARGQAAVKQATPGLHRPAAPRSAPARDPAFDLLAEHTAKLVSQMTQLIALQRKQLRILEQVFI